MASILIKGSDGSFCKYEFESRSELSSIFYQSLLSKYHLAGRVIKCGCNPKKELWMSVVSRGGLFLRTFPKITQTHEDECIFSNTASELYDEETQTYSLSLFKEPTKSEADENSSNAMKRIMAKATTFNSFCIDWISSANAFAFNIANKGNDRYIPNYTYENFRYGLNKSDIKISKIGSIENIKDRSDFFLFKGITFDDLTKYDDSDDDKSIAEIHFQDSKYIIKSTVKRVKIAIKRLKIFNNFIQPPYFVIASVSRNLAVRLFVCPVFFSAEKEQIAFIESENERDMARKLFAANRTFFKSVSDEHNRLSKKKFPYFRSQYRPDFFVFGESNILVVELSGFDTQEYID
uniref:hypothetical protein n=1 Tax=Campylobacter concisus TaxID=199 RepID=UPI00112FA095